MNKKSFIKIVSFFLSIPCLAISDILAMKNQRNAMDMFNDTPTKYTKLISGYNEKLFKLRLDLVRLAKKIFDDHRCQKLPNLKIKKKVNFVINNWPKRCYVQVIEPINDNEASELSLQLFPLASNVTVSMKRISREYYDNVYNKQMLGYQSSDHLEKLEYDLPSISDHFTYNLRLNSEELGKVSKILNEISETLQSLKYLESSFAEDDHNFIAKYHNRYANELYKYYKKTNNQGIPYAIQYQMKLMNSVSNNGKRLQNKKKAPYQTKKIKINLKDLENKKKGYVEIASKKQNSEVPHSKRPDKGTLINWDKYYNVKKTSLKRTTKR